MKRKLEVTGTAVGGGDNSFKAFFVRLCTLPTNLCLQRMSTQYPCSIVWVGFICVLLELSTSCIMFHLSCSQCFLILYDSVTYHESVVNVINSCIYQNEIGDN